MLVPIQRRIFVRAGRTQRNMADHERFTKEMFKQILIDHWGEFVERYPRYEAVSYVIKKMLGCGDPENGYAEYVCPDCHETFRVPFSCKTKFCLSCARAHLQEWVSQIEARLFEGVDYRHLVLTVPEQLRIFFYKEPKLLDGLIKIGLIMIKDVLDTYFRDSIEAGYIVVLQTGGRSASYNPHLHIMMTAGGLNSDKEWIDIKYIPFGLLHKKWQYHLFEMIKKEVENARALIDELYRKYPKGIVAHLKMEIVPRKDKLAAYLIKYVGSPPISMSRIIEYTGHEVVYWYKDHRTNKKEVIKVSVLDFIGRMVQHILPWGFKQVRYYGLHATCKAAKIREYLKGVLAKLGRKVEQVVRKIKRYSYREGIMQITGKDPLRCKICGREMRLYLMYHPKYGILYDGSSALGAMDDGQKERGPRVAGGTDRIRTGDARDRRGNVLQLSLSLVWL